MDVNSVRRPVTRKLTSARVAAIFLLMCVPDITVAGEHGVELPSGVQADAEVTIGEGEGKLSARNGVLAIRAESSALGKYAVNWIIDAAVFDFYLDEPIALPVNCASLSMSVMNPPRQGGKPPVYFRALVADSRGGKWAVGVKRGARRNQLGVSRGFMKVGLYPWSTAESGRVDPWVMQPLTPERFDAYDSPEPPMQLLGFRLGLADKGDVELKIRDLFAPPGGLKPEPYWQLQGDYVWARRLDRGQPNLPFRYGWGPAESGPCVEAADLKLGPGQYRYAWEILERDDWSMVTSDAGTFTIDEQGEGELPFPLLANGTYRLHLYVIAEGQSEGRDYLWQYVVIRNSRTPAPSDLTGGGKPLMFSTPQGRNVFGPDEAVRLRIARAPNAVVPGNSRIQWDIENATGEVVRQGEAAPGKPAVLELSDLDSSSPTFWVNARLVADGRTVDIGRRVLGVRSTLATEDKAAADVSAKLTVLDGEFRRTKGDWFEGRTSMVSRFAESMEHLKQWMDDAKTTGYNIVEFAAPWYDLEPLPDVYHFRYLDAFVEAARKRQLHVMFRVHPKPFLVPGWVRREFQADTQGISHGLWGGSTNMVYSPGSKALETAYHDFLHDLAAHFRDNPRVVGYTALHAYHDHCYFTHPWLGQYVDYSDAMRRAFVRFLRKKYTGDLKAAGRAHGKDYHSWADIAIPAPEVRTDAHGRIQPRGTGLWRDWTEQKINALVQPLRTETVAALRAGDPACAVGCYSDQARAFLEHVYPKLETFVPQGSMEAQYPPQPFAYRVRYEPHGKVSRTAMTTDIGMTNLLFHRPGWNSFFNYWWPTWTRSNVSEPIREAEERLQQWFGVVDRLVGARRVEESDAALPLLELDSLETMMYGWQHFHAARIDDYVKPFRFRAGREEVRTESLYSRAMAPEKLADRPCVYVPLNSDTFTADQLDMIVDYVAAGGTLVMEATSGLWKPGSDASNQLGDRLGLPEAIPRNRNATSPVASVSAEIAGGSFLDGVPLSFRIREFLPPIENQPTPWIHCALRNYYRRYRFDGAVSEEAEVVARFSDGDAAALVQSHGRGRVLLFCGAVDWFQSPGLLRRIDNWSRGRDLTAEPAQEPDLLTADYRKGERVFVLGRRFVSHAHIRKLKQGDVPDAVKTARQLRIRFAALPDGRYRVRELVSGTDLGAHASSVLEHDGVGLHLSRGEGFFVQAVPVED